MAILSQNKRTALKHWSTLMFSYIFPRFRKRWVFGSMGSENNAKALFLWLNENNHFGITPVWIGNSESVNEMRALGYKAHKYYGLPGKIALLTSKVWIFTSYISDLHATYYHGNACLVNLWHGVGIKSIEHKIKHGPLAEFYSEKSWAHRMNNHEKFKRPDLFLSTSPMMTAHFSECFRIPPEHCIEAGYPRCAVLDMSISQTDAYVKSYYSEAFQKIYNDVKRFSRIYFYLPTWRDSGWNVMTQSGIDLSRINDIMREQNAVFIYKPHVNTRLDTSAVGFSNIVIMEPLMEFYPLLRLTDVLVTDYSSVYYDYLLRKDGHTIFFLPDFDNYISCDRDLAFPFDENTAGTKAYNVGELEEALADVSAQHSDSSRIKSRFWMSSRDNKCLVEKILNRI